MTAAYHRTAADTEGVIFDIKEFTLHDGPGPRTTVFFKGCPLHCIWCHNPEGMDVQPTLMVKENLCTHCGACRKPCGHPECQPFGRCLHICPKNLISLAGQTVTAGELARKLVRQKDFFGSEGGVTLSGGEPLRQPAFAAALGTLLHEAGVHTALQTSGYASEEAFRTLLDAVDYVLFDLKLADEDAHIRYTGVSNRPIHRNLAVLRTSGKPFVLRIPLIQGIVAEKENLAALASLAGDEPVELMPYNPYAGAKYKMTGKEFLYQEQAAEPIPLSLFRNARIL